MNAQMHAFAEFGPENTKPATFPMVITGFEGLPAQVSRLPGERLLEEGFRMRGVTSALDQHIRLVS